MKLVNPGVGEVSDRLTILALKLHYGRHLGRDVTHFEAERAALLAKVHAQTLNASWFDSLLELGAVNAALWHAEEDLRYSRQAPNIGEVVDPVVVMDLAFKIQSWNDRRAELVEQINREAGDSAAKEKV